MKLCFPSALPHRASMRLLLLALTCTLLGCSKAAAPSEMEAPVAASPAPGTAAGAGILANTNTNSPELVDGTRRIIRIAELSLETDGPDATLSKVTTLAESRGGFVVSSDTARSRDQDGAQSVVVTIVFRVPSSAFDATLEALRALGTRVSNEKVTGQDVTEEYVDLEARLRAQRALEEQYLSVLHDAKSIPDVLAVQQKLGEVRTEIERAEGRRRYLDNQTRLSTFTVHLAKHIAAVEASGPGFGASVRRAGHDAVEVTVGIINGAIRLAGVLLPVLVLIALPATLLLRWYLRRRRRARALASAAS